MAHFKQWVMFDKKSRGGKPGTISGDIKRWQESALSTQQPTVVPNAGSCDEDSHAKGHDGVAAEKSHTSSSIVHEMPTKKVHGVWKFVPEIGDEEQSTRQVQRTPRDTPPDFAGDICFLLHHARSVSARLCDVGEQISSVECLEDKVLHHGNKCATLESSMKELTDRLSTLESKIERLESGQPERLGIGFSRNQAAVNQTEDHLGSLQDERLESESAIGVDVVHKGAGFRVSQHTQLQQSMTPANMDPYAANRREAEMSVLELPLGSLWCSVLVAPLVNHLSCCVFISPQFVGLTLTIATQVIYMMYLIESTSSKTETCDSQEGIWLEYICAAIPIGAAFNSQCNEAFEILRWFMAIPDWEPSHQEILRPFREATLVVRRAVIEHDPPLYDAVTGITWHYKVFVVLVTFIRVTFSGIVVMCSYAFVLNSGDSGRVILTCLATDFILNLDKRFFDLANSPAPRLMLRKTPTLYFRPTSLDALYDFSCQWLYLLVVVVYGTLAFRVGFCLNSGKAPSWILLSPLFFGFFFFTMYIYVSRAQHFQHKELLHIHS